MSHKHSRAFTMHGRASDASSRFLSVALALVKKANVRHGIPAVERTKTNGVRLASMDRPQCKWLNRILGALALFG